MTTKTEAQHREIAAILTPAFERWSVETNRKAKQASARSLNIHIRNAVKRGYSANLIWHYIGSEVAA